MSSPVDATLDNAHKVRAAMIECLDTREGRPRATEDGCRRLRSMLEMHGIPAQVSIGDDGLFLVKLEAG